jgi:thioredoxin 1
MTFSELINSDKPVLIDFSAEWCGPCKMLAPILEDVKTRIGDKAAVYKIDIDANPSVAEAYKIMSVPTLMVFQKGKAVWRQSGVMPARAITEVLEGFAV